MLFQLNSSAYTKLFVHVLYLNNIFRLHTGYLSSRAFTAACSLIHWLSVFAVSVAPCVLFESICQQGFVNPVFLTSAVS